MAVIRPQPRKGARRRPLPGRARMPAMTTTLTATLRTTEGPIVIRLLPDHAPKTVRNFVDLAQGGREWTDPRTGRATTGRLYNGTIFHRVIPNFMIQGGDPLGNGTGDPGYKFKDEFSPDLTFDQPGRLAMANSGPATNGSQFFITEVPTPHLTNRHTIFGQCTPESVELVKEIARRPRDERTDRPFQDVKINSITITGPGAPVAKKAPVRRRTGTAAGTTKRPASTTKKPQSQPQ